ncbi:MAG: peptide deformylase [Nocardioides sp.]
MSSATSSIGSSAGSSAEPAGAETAPETTPKTTPPIGLPAGGRVRPITRWGTPVMHRTARPVTSYDECLHTLVADMVATMYAANGVGLAACQIGEDLSVFVFDCPDADERRVFGVVCNPVLTLPEAPERRLEVDEEGCLSFPGAFTECARPDVARVDGADLNGDPISFEGTGLLARCLQHETDHTLGTVFGDRISAKARKGLGREHERAAPDYPAQWPVGPRGDSSASTGIPAR